MPATFTVFELGTGVRIQAPGPGITSLNHNAFNGVTFGGVDTPLFASAREFSPDPATGPGVDGDPARYNTDNASPDAGFLIDGFDLRYFDAVMLYAGTTITYADGTTAVIDVAIMQDKGGMLYLVPPPTGPNATTNALEAKPITSITLGTAQPAGTMNNPETYSMYADRYDLALKDGVVEGTEDDDLIDASYTGDPDGDRIDGNDNFAGNNDDLVFAHGGNDTVIAGLGNDTVYGGAGDDQILGGDGDDLLLGDEGNDSLNGGAGNDTLYGGEGNDTLDGGEGDDVIKGGDGDDVVSGGDGNDTLAGGAGNDSLYGGDGDDLIYGGANPADNTVIVSHEDFESGASGWSDNRTEDFAGGGTYLGRFAGSGDTSGAGGAPVTKTFDLVSGNSAVVVEFDLLVFDSWDAADPGWSEGPFGDAFQIYVNGNLVTSQQFAWSNPAYNGFRTGSTEIDGVSYRFTFEPGELGQNLGGNPDFPDQLWRVRLEAEDYTAPQITIGLAATTDQDLPDESFGIDNFTLLSTNDPNASVAEALAGGPDGDNWLDGGSGNDTIHGGTGKDTILGDEGDDLIYGGDGNDLIFGGDGDDLIFGGDGNDTLDGGSGNNTLTGGAGNDVFVWDGASNTVVTDWQDGITGAIGNGDATDNDFVDLSTWYNTTTLTAVNGAGGNFGHALGMLWADAADGVIDGIIDGIDYSAALGMSGTLELQGADASNLTFDTTNVLCFVRGTLIKTAHGEIAVEDLLEGDPVLTLDNGYQPIRWIGSTRRQATGDLAPIEIKAGTLGNTRDLRVSPQHRMLLSGWQASMMFGEAEVLASAKSLVNDRTIRRIEGGVVEYFHILFDRHEIIFAEGAPSESFHPGEQGWTALDAATRQEILDLFPELAVTGVESYGDAARVSLRAYEARAIGAALGV